MNLIDINTRVFVWIKSVEIWKSIDYPGINGKNYEVSNHGNIRNKKTCRSLKPFPDGKG